MYNPSNILFYFIYLKAIFVFNTKYVFISFCIFKKLLKYNIRF